MRFSQSRQICPAANVVSARQERGKVVVKMVGLGRHWVALGLVGGAFLSLAGCGEVSTETSLDRSARVAIAKMTRDPARARVAVQVGETARGEVLACGELSAATGGGGMSRGERYVAVLRVRDGRVVLVEDLKFVDALSQHARCGPAGISPSPTL